MILTIAYVVSALLAFALMDAERLPVSRASLAAASISWTILAFNSMCNFAGWTSLTVGGHDMILLCGQAGVVSYVFIRLMKRIGQQNRIRLGESSESFPSVMSSRKWGR